MERLCTKFHASITKCTKEMLSSYGCGFDSPLRDWKFFSSFLFLHFSFLAFLTLTVLRVYSGECASVGRVLRVYRAGLLSIDFDQKHSSGRILGLTANFQFRGPIASINISKESQGYGDLLVSGPRILKIDPVILKLSRFYQVQSERERTLVHVLVQE